jgi:hypothetical protein
MDMPEMMARLLAKMDTNTTEIKEMTAKIFLLLTSAPCEGTILFRITLT